jgi:hypothetical protein
MENDIIIERSNEEPSVDSYSASRHVLSIDSWIDTHY